MVLMAYPEIQHVTACAVWVHERTYTTYQMPRADMDAWRDGLVAKLTDPNPKYGPSESVCRYCPYQATCKARLALLGGALAVIDGTAGGEITHSRLLAAHEAVTAIEARLKQFRAELRAMIHRNGPIVADGKELFLRESSPRTIDFHRARPVLEDRLTPKELSACVKVGVGNVIKAVRSKVKRGKQVAENEFIRELAEENAITYATQYNLTLKTEE